jgi:hypothetical protein
MISKFFLISSLSLLFFLVGCSQTNMECFTKVKKEIKKQGENSQMSKLEGHAGHEEKSFILVFDGDSLNLEDLDLDEKINLKPEDYNSNLYRDYFHETEDGKKYYFELDEKNKSFRYEKSFIKNNIEYQLIKEGRCN